MPYVIPAMPITLAAWYGYDETVSAYSAPDQQVVPCNLSPGKRVMINQGALNPFNFSAFTMEILLEKGSKLSPGVAPGVKEPDLVEIPEGSHCFYRVGYVDIIGAGFANEHFFALIHMHMQETVFVDVTWPFETHRPPAS